MLLEYPGTKPLSAGLEVMSNASRATFQNFTNLFIAVVVPRTTNTSNVADHLKSQEQKVARDLIWMERMIKSRKQRTSSCRRFHTHSNLLPIRKRRGHDRGRAYDHAFGAACKRYNTVIEANLPVLARSQEPVATNQATRYDNSTNMP